MTVVVNIDGSEYIHDRSWNSVQDYIDKYCVPREITPYLNPRVDLLKYYESCRKEVIFSNYLFVKSNGETQ